MNFFPAKIRMREGKLVVDADSFALDIPTDRKSVYEDHIGKPIIFGIRPEDIGSAAAEQEPDAQRIKARVDVVEPMGSESYVYLSVGEATFISRVDAHRRFSVGQTAEPAVFMDKAHFFDPTTEQVIV